MIFTLEALRARFGDALLLHYGPREDRRLVVIDGGPPGVYKDSLRPRLQELKEEIEGPLPIRLLMVSHIDGDHISGILSLAREMLKEQNASRPAPYRITTLWHNSFDDLLGNKVETLGAALNAAAADAAAAAAAGGEPPADLPVNFETAAVVANVPQGRELRNMAEQLNLLVNDPFGELVMAPPVGAQPLDIGGGLSFTVVGPNQQLLRDLQTEWDIKLQQFGLAQVADTVAADFLDKSVPNLSSIVVIAEADGKRMLLTGDARGDHILSGLRKGGFMPSGTAHFDLLKVPHHGSDRNVSTEFFRRVTADHYVISGDGSHGNPDIPTLQMISDARGDAHFTLYITNHEDRLQEFFEKERAAGKQYDVVFRADDELSVVIDLGEPLRQEEEEEV